MPLLRLALAQVNPTVGDLAGNAGLVRHWSARAARAGARLVAFPELMLTGHPVEDLVFRESFVAASQAALTGLAADLAGDGLGGLAVLVGYLDAGGPVQAPAGEVREPGPRNALALLQQGRVVCRYYQHHLPHHGVFDEDRYFVPGDTLQVVRLGPLTGDQAAAPGVEGAGAECAADDGPVDVALTIGADLARPGGPCAVARSAGVGLVITVSGSPYERSQDDRRPPLVASRAAEAGATVAYVNLVGGQDELIFDGNSMIVAPDGELLARAGQFREHLLVHDLVLPAAEPVSPAGPTPPAEPPTEPLPYGPLRVSRAEVPGVLAPPPGPPAVGGIADRLPPDEELWQALVLGLRDYAGKNGFHSVLLGLSGGLDSSVAAAIAVDALGPERVVGVAMPSQHTTSHSREDASELAKRTGLDFRTEPIQPMVDTFLANLSLSGTAVENLQARVRGVILMAISNQEGQLVLTTSNKSELAVGYTTLYGDSVGGFNPLKDLPKTTVGQLARWRNQAAVAAGQTPPIPERVITKPPSAELRPGQRDTDTLPPYDVLDAILADYVDGGLGRDALVEAGHEPALVDRVIRMVDRAEHKRRQSAPGPRVSGNALSRDRRLPITNRFR